MSHNQRVLCRHHFLSSLVIPFRFPTVGSLSAPGPPNVCGDRGLKSHWILSSPSPPASLSLYVSLCVCTNELTHSCIKTSYKLILDIGWIPSHIVLQFNFETVFHWLNPEPSTWPAWLLASPWDAPPCDSLWQECWGYRCTPAHRGFEDVLKSGTYAGLSRFTYWDSSQLILENFTEEKNPKFLILWGGMSNES